MCKRWPIGIGQSTKLGSGLVAAAAGIVGDIDMALIIRDHIDD